MFVFPLHVFNPGSQSADVVEKVVSGGKALNDEETSIATDGGGRWEGSLGDIDLDDPYVRRLWEAWTSHIAGGSRAFLMPVPALDIAPAPVVGLETAWPSDIEADDDWFPTTVGFALPWIVARTVGVSGSPPGLMTIVVERGSRLTPGMRFGIGGNRSHKIQRITSRNGQQATCLISPPNRIAYPSGTPVNFDWPLVQVKGAIGQGLAPQFTDGYATTSLSFVEDFSNAD